MPTVPVLRTPTVTQQPLRSGSFTSHATPDQFGAGIAESVRRGIDVAGNIYTHERQKIGQMRVNDQRAKFNKFNFNLLNGENGIYGLHGDALIGVSADTGEKSAVEVMMKEAARLRDELTGDEKDIFWQDAVETIQHQQLNLSTFERKEIEAAELMKLETLVETSTDTIVANYGTPLAKTETDKTLDAIMIYGDHHNLGDDVINAQQKKFLTNVHAGVVESMLSEGKAVEAKAYIAENKDQIFEEVENKLRDKVKPIADSQYVQTTADKYYVPGNLAKGRDAYLEKHATDPLRPQVVAELEHRYSVDETLRSDNERTQYRDFYELWSLTRNHNANAATRKAFADLPPEIREDILRMELSDAMHARQMSALSAQERADNAKAQEIVSSTLWGNAMRQKFEDPEIFISRDFVKEYGITGLMNRVELKEIIQEQDALREKRRNGDTDVALDSQADDYMITKAIDAGILNRTYDAVDLRNDKMVKLRTRYRQWKQDRLTADHKAPSVLEMQDEIDALVTKVIVENPPNPKWGWYSGFANRLNHYSEAYAFEKPEFNPDGTIVIRIPARDREQLIQALSISGESVTEESIMKLYKTTKGIK